jgi:hypothetical protein
VLGGERARGERGALRREVAGLGPRMHEEVFSGALSVTHLTAMA